MLDAFQRCPPARYQHALYRLNRWRCDCCNASKHAGAGRRGQRVPGPSSPRALPPRPAHRRIASVGAAGPMVPRPVRSDGTVIWYWRTGHHGPRRPRCPPRCLGRGGSDASVMKTVAWWCMCYCYIKIHVRFVIERVPTYIHNQRGPKHFRSIRVYKNEQR